VHDKKCLDIMESLLEMGSIQTGVPGKNHIEFGKYMLEIDFMEMGAHK
jgi:hypothetical protein